jgi:ABC-type cobalt transport system substrate-binding protein
MGSVEIEIFDPTKMWLAAYIILNITLILCFVVRSLAFIGGEIKAKHSFSLIDISKKVLFEKSIDLISMRIEALFFSVMNAMVLFGYLTHLLSEIL